MNCRKSNVKLSKVFGPCGCFVDENKSSRSTVETAVKKRPQGPVTFDDSTFDIRL